MPVLEKSKVDWIDEMNFSDKQTQLYSRFSKQVHSNPSIFKRKERVVYKSDIRQRRTKHLKYFWRFCKDRGRKTFQSWCANFGS